MGNEIFDKTLQRMVHATVMVSKSWRHCDGSGDGTGSRTGKNLDEGPVGIPEPSKISSGMFGGARQVRTAASQFCSLPDESMTNVDRKGSSGMDEQ